MSEINQKLSVFRYVLTLLCLLALLSACREASYPTVLVQADSAYVQGDYELADSLLDAYDVTTIAADKHLSMYYHLLTLERKFVAGKLTEDDFSLSDSLCRYYQDQDNCIEKFAKAEIILALVYQVVSDYPNALHHGMKAKSLAEICGKKPLKGWIYKEIADLYFKQRMFDECIPYYQAYHLLSSEMRDTLRMAYSSFCMGRVYMVRSNVDSILYFFQQAVDLGQHTQRPENIVPAARAVLTDIYIQIGEFKKASDMMPRDSLNEYNWAYWHLGQQHNDSAIWYFRKMAEQRSSVSSKAEYLRILANLYKLKGDVQQSVDCYEQYVITEDSVRALSNAEDMRRVKAQYNYNLIQTERDDLETDNTKKKTLIGILAAIVVVLLAVLTVFIQHYRSIKKKEKLQQKIIVREKEFLHSQSMQRVTENEKAIETLRKQQEEASHQGDIEMSEKITMEIDMLTLQSQYIETTWSRKEALLNEFRKSPLYLNLKIHGNDKNDNYRLTDDDWKSLASTIDEIYDGFTHRLLSLADLTQSEIRVCYLVKLKISPTAIANQLFITKGGITHIRSRMYLKITGKKGTSKDFDDFIDKF